MQDMQLKLLFNKEIKLMRRQSEHKSRDRVQVIVISMMKIKVKKIIRTKIKCHSLGEKNTITMMIKK